MSRTATLRAGASTYTLAAKPNGNQGNPAQVAHATAAVAPSWWWWSLAGIPADAVISEAPFTVRQSADYPAPGGTRTVTALRCAAWKTSTLTHNHQPALRTESASASRTTASPKGTAWVLDLADLVQAALGHGALYFRLVSNSATVRYLRGVSAATLRPELVVVYDTVTPPPSGLSPDGAAVSSRTPAISWTPWPGQLGYRVQVSADPTFATVDYDSTLLTSPESSHPLAGSGYQLPADGTHVYVRALRNGPLGLSGWSPVAETWYSPLPAIVLTNPVAVVPDGTPPITWDVTFGAQAIYRALITQDGNRLWDSKPQKDPAARAVAPTSGVTRLGSTATARVEVTDDELRVAVPGAPVTAVATVDFTVTDTDSVNPVTDLTIETDLAAPWATADWSWPVLPDEWALIATATNTIVDRFPGTDAAIGGTRYQRRFYKAPPNWQTTYRMAPVSNGAIAAGGNESTITPTVKGLCLVDPATGEEVRILGRDEPEGSYPSLVETSSPLDLGYDVVRELSLRGWTGDLTGYLADAYGVSPEDAYRQLLAFKSDGRPLRLAWSLVNIPVVLHSVSPTPVRAGVSVDSKRFNVKAVAVQQGENPF